MSISRGARLGPYEVIAPAGSGGMGEVWRARDTRLDRSVAIKVLPREFADNAQLKVRFEREAKVISQLSHPNICTLYDVGQENGVEYLVMEFLEGETLADRLARGPLPLDQVTRYGIEVAEALEKAHKAGVTHRDLKPGNVMITKSGAKLLDFGLAKPNGLENAASVLTSLRTEARQPLTEEGTIVGTFQYMAPEQIEGAAVDARTDIFALGALLYEMATGRRAFSGKSKASLIASILTTEPAPISAVQPATPAMLDRIIRTCLAKEPDERFQSAHDVAEALRWTADVPLPVTTATSARKRDRVAWTSAALLAIVALAGGAAWWREVVARRTAPAIRTAVLPPENGRFEFRNFTAPPAIAPDGRKIVFGVAIAGKRQTLWVRSLDSVNAQQLAGTEGAIFPFWSPDGRSVGFFADNALKRIDAAGGAPVVVCSVVDGRGGSWSSDGRTIIFAGRYTPIYRVAASGGTPVEVTKLAGGSASHRWPQFLPDGRHFLYLDSPTGSDDPRNTICVGDAVDGKLRKPLVKAAFEPHYLNGHIIFTRDGILTAQPFDAGKLEITDDAITLKEPPIDGTPLLSRSIVAVSTAGTLVYQSGVPEQTSALSWIDRSGKVLPTLGEAARYRTVAIAPDGKRVVAADGSKPPANLWLFDERGVKTRLTFHEAFDSHATWSPDGRKIAYASIGTGRLKIYVHDLTTGSEQLLFDAPTPGNPGPSSWSADGQRLMFTTGGQSTRSDIWWMSLADRKPQPYLVTPAVESLGRFSPDGKWIAYQSNASGTVEVYLAPFPATGAKWQVSNGGGVAPRWRGDGKELYYVRGTGSAVDMVAVPVTAGAAPQFGQATTLFSFRRISSGGFDVTADGQRFLITTASGEEPPPAPLVVVQNFDNELRRAIASR